MSQKRNTKRGNYRSVSHLCPNCFSTLSQNSQGAMICTGDRLAEWQKQYQEFKQLPEDDQQEFLDALDQPDRFLELASLTPGQSCGNSSKISHVAPNNSQRIPDPMAVARLERTLHRTLADDELDEEYVFQVNGQPYQLPFINFPEDV